MAHKKYLTVEAKKDALLKNNRVYGKTLKGKLVHTYNNMDRRVRGYSKPHLYEGLSIMSRRTFYVWSLDNPDYIFLYKNWVKSDYDNKLSPSIDRIDSRRGYTIGNIRWITHSENSKLGNESRIRQNKHL